MRNICLLFLWLASLALSAAAEATETRYYIVNNSTEWTVRPHQLLWNGPDIGPGQRADYAPGPLGRVEIYYRPHDGGRWWYLAGVEHAGDLGCWMDAPKFETIGHVMFVISQLPDYTTKPQSFSCATVNLP